MISETIPHAPRISMYTSGWPKNQNVFSQCATLPPCAGSKNVVPNRRSDRSMISPAVSTGAARTTRNDVDSVDQVKTGIRMNDMPGARNRRIVTMKLMAPRIDAVPTIISPRIQRSWPVPPWTESGT
jgi:hypothetical protein